MRYGRWKSHTSPTPWPGFRNGDTVIGSNSIQSIHRASAATVTVATSMAILSTRQVIEQATAHHQAGRLKDAEALLRAVIEREPNYAEALHRLGVVLAA